MPIGAGLKSIPKSALIQQRTQKKTQRRPAVGSRAGFTLTLVALAAIVLLADFEPWRNDWETVRILFGDQPSNSMEGTWSIVKAKLVDASQAAEYPDDLTGTFVFNHDNVVRLNLARGSTQVVGSGEYAQHGPNLLLRNMKAEQGDSDGIPKKVGARISWMDDNLIVAEVDNTEVLYLQRQ